MIAIHEYAVLGLMARGRHMIWLILVLSKASHDSHKPWRQRRRLDQPHRKPVTSTCRPSAAHARLRSMDERSGQANTDCSLSSRASDGLGGRECTPMDVGVCWDFARLGKCRTGGCTLQHMTADGLMEAIGRDTEVELVSQPLLESTCRRTLARRRGQQGGAARGRTAWATQAEVVQRLLVGRLQT